jgi:hypothetical protein
VNICDSQHEQIVYEGRLCPLCYAIEQHEKAVTKLENQISDLEDTEKSLLQEISEKAALAELKAK